MGSHAAGLLSATFFPVRGALPDTAVHGVTSTARPAAAQRGVGRLHESGEMEVRGQDERPLATALLSETCWLVAFIRRFGPRHGG